MRLMCLMLTPTSDFDIIKVRWDVPDDRDIIQHRVKPQFAAYWTANSNFQKDNNARMKVVSRSATSNEASLVSRLGSSLYLQVSRTKTLKGTLRVIPRAGGYLTRILSNKSEATASLCVAESSSKWAWIG